MGNALTPETPIILSRSADPPSRRAGPFQDADKATQRCSTPPLILIASPAHRHLASPRHIEVLCRRFSDRPLAAKQHRAHRLASRAHMAEHAASLQAFYLVPTPLPCHINPAFLIFPFFLSINPLDFLFCLVQRSKPNTVDALTSRPQSRPSIHRSLPPQKMNTERSLDYIAVRDCRRRRTFPSFSFSYSQLFRSVLVFISAPSTYKYYRLAPHRIIRSSKHQRPPFYLSRV